MRLRYLLYLLLLIGFGTGALAQDNVALTETFTSAEYEFAFDYPAGWMLSTRSGGFEPMAQRLTHADYNVIDIDYLFATPDDMAENYIAYLAGEVDVRFSRASEIVTIPLTHGTAYRLEMTGIADADARILIYLRDIENKLFRLYTLHIHGTPDIEPVMLAIMDSIRLIPAEIDLAATFQQDDVKFTFHYPAAWEVKYTSPFSESTRDHSGLGTVVFLTPSGASISVNGYRGVTPAEAIIAPDRSAFESDFAKQRLSPLVLADRQGLYAEYAARFYEQRFVYLLASGENTIEVTLEAEHLDFAPEYQRMIRALLLTVEEVN
jgi:hypothetical protein